LSLVYDKTACPPTRLIKPATMPTAIIGFSSDISYFYCTLSPKYFPMLRTTIGVYLMVFIIPIVFYSYTAFTGKSVFVIDILTFIVAVIIGQLASYKLLTYKQLPSNLEKFSLVALVILGLAFVLFTFYPPQLPIFRDPISGEYGIVNPTH
jgi:hypothetical protein